MVFRWLWEFQGIQTSIAKKPCPPLWIHVIFSVFLSQDICCGYLKEPSIWAPNVLENIPNFMLKYYVVKDLLV